MVGEQLLAKMLGLDPKQIEEAKATAKIWIQDFENMKADIKDIKFMLRCLVDDNMEEEDGTGSEAGNKAGSVVKGKEA